MGWSFGGVEDWEGGKEGGERTGQIRRLLLCPLGRRTWLVGGVVVLGINDRMTC